MWYSVLEDYSEYEQKVRAIMYCLSWDHLSPEKYYNLSKTEYYGSWFQNCPDDKTQYYKDAQKYLRRDKVLRIKDKMLCDRKTYTIEIDNEIRDFAICTKNVDIIDARADKINKIKREL